VLVWSEDYDQDKRPRQEDVEFIAHAPEDLRLALNALQDSVQLDYLDLEALRGCIYAVESDERSTVDTDRVRAIIVRAALTGEGE
jgi:hypothetical protein